jgi:hypothetical protein
MFKQVTLAMLLLFGLSTLPAVAADAPSEGTQAETPKDKAPEGGAEGEKKKEEKKSGDKKGGEEPNCE